MDSKFNALAERLKAKLGGSNGEMIVADDSLTDLVDAHLDLVSAAHSSAHASGHGSLKPK
jgi:hypothetical protein